MARSVSLTLRFQRDLAEDAGELAPILEEPPIVLTIDTPLLPANAPDFWHESTAWQNQGTLQLCQKRSGAMWEVYRWYDDCFTGTAKINWTPHISYLQDEEDATDVEYQRDAATTG